MKDSYLRSFYHRIRARRGTEKAIIAVAASMLTSVYYILKNGVSYLELCPSHFDQLHQVRTVNRVVHRLVNLGYDITIKRRELAA